MTKEELIDKLEELIFDDPENGHMVADKLLLKYINDAEITESFDKINKWYA